MATLFMVTGCSALNTNIAQFDAITPQSIAACVNVYDHPLEETVKFDTEKCYRQRSFKYNYEYLIDKPAKGDVLIRAFKNKTGEDATAYQIYTILALGDWYFPESANFKINGKLIQRQGKRVAHNVEDCYSIGCVIIEHFVFSLTEDEIKMIISNTDDLDAPARFDVREFMFHIKGKSTQGIDRFLNVAEIEGFYNYVTAYDVKQKAKAN